MRITMPTKSDKCPACGSGMVNRTPREWVGISDMMVCPKSESEEEDAGLEGLVLRERVGGKVVRQVVWCIG